MYGFRIAITNHVSGETKTYCVTDHFSMVEACSELKAYLEFKPEDRLTHTFHCIGYAPKQHTDIQVDAQYEYVYEACDTMPD